VQPLYGAHQFGVQLLFSEEFLQILVAREDLVCPLARQDDLDVPRRELR
jgi:hypothetical protein